MFTALCSIVSGVVIMTVTWTASDRRYGAALLATGWCVGAVAFAAGLSGLLAVATGGAT
jgi:hypothetical protein